MNKRALITGGTAGIGLGIAEIFAQNGIDLVLTYFHDQARAQQVKNNLETYGVVVQVKKCNTQQKEDLKALFENIWPVDILVNNIGASMPDAWLGDWEAMFHYHLMGTVHATEFFSEQYMWNSWCIINISSILGIDPLLYHKGVRLEAYCCIKSAVNTYTKISANTYKNKIRVCAIAPGNTESDSWKWADPVFKKSREKWILLGRFVAPKEIGEFALQIIRNESLNGQVFVVDGWVVGRWYEE